MKDQFRENTTNWTEYTPYMMSTLKSKKFVPGKERNILYMFNKLGIRLSLLVCLKTPYEIELIEIVQYGSYTKIIFNL